MGNVTRVTKTSGLGNRTYTYVYDEFGRLKRANDGNNNTILTYDSNGNLLTRNQTQISALGMTQQEVYTYDSVDKDKLKRVTINNSNGQTIYDLLYITGSLNLYRLVKTVNGVEEIKEISFEGKRLKRFGKTVYGYDDNGIRTSKIVYSDDNLINVEEEHVYTVEGNRIIRERITTTIDNNYYDLYYNYNINGELVSVNLGNSVFFYVKDALGNINHIIDTNGNIMVSYEYNEWGKVSKTIRNENCPIGELNPFMYKSYYYDKETSLFYCNSRYYSPELCRFISIDDVSYLDPSSINGLNLYAYCANNPVMYVDPSGHFPWLVLVAVAAVVLFTPAGGTIAQVATSVVSYAGIAVASIFDEDIRNDMNAIGWNPFNTNESATLNSSKVSFYKGVPVFRTPAGGRSGSFGAIFLTKGSGVDTLRHERGHNWQLMTMGIANYGLMIGLPSWLEWSNRSYYDRPWEITADVFGGVTGRTHTQADINRGYWYLGVSSLFGPLGYLFLFGEY